MPTLTYEIDQLLQVNLDDLVLKAEAGNALPALDAYRQQIEDYLDVLRDMIETQGNGVQRLRRKQRQYESLSAEVDCSARQFLQEGQEKLVRAATARKRVMQLASAAYKKEADGQSARFLALMDAKLRLEARLTEVEQRAAAVLVWEMRSNDGAQLQMMAG